MNDARPEDTFMAVTFSEVPENLTDILIAGISDAGYEGIAEEPGKLTAYIRAGNFSREVIHEMLGKYPFPATMSWNAEQVPDRNWNELWESNYAPVMIAGRVYVRAPFHPDLSILSARGLSRVRIIIEPKMSFGTAHHETTAMMIEYMLDEEMKGKKVLDMGCGTGVLAILACMLGASEAVAVDNDDWAVANATENAEKNNVTAMTVIQGDACECAGSGFHLVVANITRNVLLRQMPGYAAALAPGGRLIVSGILSADLAMVAEQAGKNGFQFVDSHQKNNWIAARFTR